MTCLRQKVMKNFWLRLHYTAVAIALALIALQAFVLSNHYSTFDADEIPHCFEVALILSYTASFPASSSWPAAKATPKASSWQFPPSHPSCFLSSQCSGIY